MSRARSFHDLTVLGQARRLRPLAAEALRNYAIDTRGLRLISNEWNGVFRIDTPTGPRVIRITRPVPGALPRPVRSEVAFMTALASETGIAVPTVLANRDGGLVTLAGTPGVPRPRECVVFGWLAGTNLASRMNPGSWAALGELMGRMHQFSSTWKPPTDFEVPTFDHLIPYGEPLVVFEQDPAELLGLQGLLREAADATEARLSTLAGQGSAIVTHADLHQWNVKTWHGVLSPFDFEDLLWAAPILDVATSLYYVRDREDYPALAAAFRRGYERQRAWVEHEPGEVDRLVFARAFLLLNALFLDGGLAAGDRESFVRRHENLALIALGERAAVLL